MELSGKGRVHTESTRPGGQGGVQQTMAKGQSGERAAHRAVATGTLEHTRTLPDKKAGYKVHDG